MIEIRNIIEAFDKIDHTCEKVALASVVSVEESSYRRIGARMLVSSSGHWVGGISGGCLEGHALKKAQNAIYNQKPTLVTYDTMDNEANEIGVGLGCNGRIGVLFTPIKPEDTENEIEKLRTISQLPTPTVLLKIIEADSFEHLLGKIKTIRPSELVSNFAGINDDTLNKEIAEVFHKRKSKIIDIHSSDATLVKVLIEFIRPEMHVVLVGDNYDIDAMTKAVQTMGWELTIVGQHKKLSKVVFSRAAAVISYDAVKKLTLHEYTAVVLMSHDYNRDKKMLEYFIHKKPVYLGLLGPKKRFHKMIYEMSHIDSHLIDRVYSPAGLEIGAESPEEIALSIVSEIVAVFRQKSGGSLRLKQGAIHDREEM